MSLNPFATSLFRWLNPSVTFNTPRLWGRRHWWFSLFLWILTIAPASAALELRVAIEEGASRIRVGTSTNAILRNGAGQSLGQLPSMNAQEARLQGGRVSLAGKQAEQIWVEPNGEGLVWIGDRWYRGRTLLLPVNGGLAAVNYVDLEQYLYSVLGAEMSPNWPQEALKAQAVAARSFALNRRQKATGRYFDVDDTIASQVYRGVKDEAPTTQAAVNATAGQVLTYNGQVIEAVFHSSSGGHTENVEDVWSTPLPYLRGVPDFDQGAPVFQWTKDFTQEQLSRLIAGVGNVISMTPIRKTPQGRVVSMKVVGTAGQRTISGRDLRDALGLRSTLFAVIPKTGQNKSAVPTAFQVVGRGFGHGLGMSQWGAYSMAQQGYNYQQIVLHYYRGAQLARIEVR
ncbi:SpoIID/LytB domain-containing protein [Trichothermofontia sichuanensis B231]|uniref:SpoIID/LytB domain-containing protein n=1 Tax=Trichothermofontia sichuanensis TaxID=3045816 RepID=UPI0022458407|nr:SpoIID/LytB domain-containing protein [Trichothermofontia sichuanensis]UZQ53632.1 SpoIID/LytB domain-containing protein [Trichothermofontia sichuanensis B231]